MPPDSSPGPIQPASASASTSVRPNDVSIIRINFRASCFISSLYSSITSLHAVSQQGFSAALGRWRKVVQHVWRRHTSIMHVPEGEGVVVGPERASVVERGAGDGEALGPHQLGEEAGDAGAAVAGDALCGARRLELPVGGEGEEATCGGLDAPEETRRDAVSGDLERAPGLAGSCYLFEHVGAGGGEVDDGDGRPLRGGRGVVVEVRPRVRVRDFADRLEVERVRMVVANRLGGCRHDREAVS
ncbi:hypothetical protein B296_00053983 [Ensete ventricosum]|uniref:Uncharacterized protein n=1 Tax=Ensete ventricosum TaxID=4639 RepID=A0A426WYJ2_ENSVE|nr:hypothetical protein B296_00053983 [Ensete ventricosum]